MLRAYKYRIYPTDDQKVLLAKTFGCCRFVYNWALNMKIEAYRQEKKSIGNVELTNRMKSVLKSILNLCKVHCAISIPHTGTSSVMHMR